MLTHRHRCLSGDRYRDLLVTVQRPPRLSSHQVSLKDNFSVGPQTNACTIQKYRPVEFCNIADNLVISFFSPIEYTHCCKLLLLAGLTGPLLANPIRSLSSKERKQVGHRGHTVETHGVLSKTGDLTDCLWQKDGETAPHSKQSCSRNWLSWIFNERKWN